MIGYATTLDGITDERLDGFWVGWPDRPSAALHRAMLEGSEAFVLAIDEAAGGRVVGFVNAVGDGVMTAYVPCLEVLPAYQRRGIGTELMRRLLACLGDRYIVDLVCDEDAVPFYERLGLVRAGAMIRRHRSGISSANARLVDASRESMTSGGGLR